MVLKVVISVDGYDVHMYVEYAFYDEVHFFKTLIVTPVCSDAKTRTFHLIKEHSLQIRNSCMIQGLTSL